MSDTSRAVLLVADISGYTKFMREQAVSMSHAKQIIVRLLKALIRVSRPPLQVAELEGDAVFFYALAGEHGFKDVCRSVKEQLMEFFREFYRELGEVDQLRTCECDACMQVTNLRLKQVVHAGDVSIEKIDRFEKLFGLDVILVHRMLKNSVPSPEYVMMTRPVYDGVGDLGVQIEKRRESFEGIGEVDTFVFYPGIAERSILATDGSPTPSGKLRWRVVLSWNTLLDLLHLRRPQGVFRDLS